MLHSSFKNSFLNLNAPLYLVAKNDRWKWGGEWVAQANVSVPSWWTVYKRSCIWHNCSFFYSPHCCSVTPHLKNDFKICEISFALKLFKMVCTKVTPFGNNHPTSSCDEELPVAQSSKGREQSLTPTIRQIWRELFSTPPCKASGSRPFPHTETLAL
jgi:hypothetical protein